MRSAFANAIYRLAKKDKNIWLITGDLGYSVLEDFAKDFPDQFLNIGVAEQNMIGVSAGAALSGKTVFAYSIIPFITLRALEQLRDDVCLQNANVKLVGVGEGFTYGALGPTHHSIEDIAVTRSIPNISVVCPGDPMEAEIATEQIAKNFGPFYLRLGKKGDPVVHKSMPKLKIGKAIKLKSGKDAYLITTGNMLPVGMDAARILEDEGISVGVISMHTVKPLDVDILKEVSSKVKGVFTLEEHSIIGGLGSAVSEWIAESGTRIKFRRFGVYDKFTKFAGTGDYLRKINNLDSPTISKKILNILSAKD